MDFNIYQLQELYYKINKKIHSNNNKSKLKMIDDMLKKC